MEALRIYLNNKSTAEQVLFAKKCGTTIGYLRKAIYTGAELGPVLSVNIENVSHGEVTRKDLHPNDFLKKWPELSSNNNEDEAA